MGEMADYYLDLAFNPRLCDQCGNDIDWCCCDGPRYPPKEHIEGCDGEEVQRTNKQTQVQFIGCSNFPKCKYSRSI